MIVTASDGLSNDNVPSTAMEPGIGDCAAVDLQRGAGSGYQRPSRAVDQSAIILEQQCVIGTGRLDYSRVRHIERNAAAAAGADVAIAGNGVVDVFQRFGLRRHTADRAATDRESATSGQRQGLRPAGSHWIVDCQGGAGQNIDMAGIGDRTDSDLKNATGRFQRSGIGERHIGHNVQRAAGDFDGAERIVDNHRPVGAGADLAGA